MNYYLGYFENKRENSKEDVQIVKAETKEDARLKWRTNYIKIDEDFRDHVTYGLIEKFQQGCFDECGNEINPKATNRNIVFAVNDFFENTDYAKMYIDFIYNNGLELPLEFYLYVLDRECEEWVGKIIIVNVKDISI